MICVVRALGVGMELLSELGVVGTVVRPLASVQRMKSATGALWDLGGWAGWEATVGVLFGGFLLGCGLVRGDGSWEPVLRLGWGR